MSFESKERRAIFGQRTDAAITHVYRLLPLVVDAPTTPRLDATLVFVHGYTQHVTHDTVRALAASVRDHMHARGVALTVVLPQARDRRLSLVPSHGVHPAWYDLCEPVVGIDGGVACDGFDDSVRELRALIEHEDIVARTQNGGVPRRVFVVGFSQGSNVALHAAYSCTAPLGGVVILSGYLTLAREFRAEVHAHRANCATPLLWMHGQRDPTIRPRWGLASYQAARASGVLHGEFHSYRRLRHGVTDAELARLVTWMRAQM